ncbi:hypothetical protein [Streptomyces sp. NPDC055107]
MIEANVCNPDAPDAGVLAMLLEVDRVNEAVDVPVNKVRRYTERFELLSPKADKDRERVARAFGGVRLHDFRLWSRITRGPVMRVTHAPRVRVHG